MSGASSRSSVPRRHRQLDPQMKRVVEGFVTWLNEIEGEAARVESWPDSETTGNPVCDAILVRDGREAWVEHTRVMHSEWEFRIQRLTERLRAEIAPRLRAAHPDRATWIDVPMEDVKKSTLHRLATSLGDACEKAIDRLKPGGRATLHVDGLGAPVHVTRLDDGADPGEHIVWAIASTEPLAARLRRQILTPLEKKSKKHAGPGPPMILILDSPLAPLPHMHLPSLTELASLPEMRVFHELWLAGSATDPVSFAGPIRAGHRYDADALFRRAHAGWSRLRHRRGS